ncbi:MAG: hypothetical protein MRY81_10125 [Donghicola eburneus]|nr:hypothetical protein [Donghicola eburneus]MCI5040029.1 hypothetical protein [Donghicola eburneus]
MTTVRDIVSRALRKARVLEHGGVAENDNLVEGLADLNMMMAAWKLSAVDVGHTTLDANSTFPLNPEFEEGTVYMLAARISTDFAYPVGFDADDFFRSIQASYATVGEVTMPSLLLKTSSQIRRY